MKELESLFLDTVHNTIPMSYLQGSYEHKVPWINNICFADADAGRIRDELGKREICVSRTSACSKSGERSHVLEAIGTAEALQSGAIRVSFGSRTNEERVRTALAALREIVFDLREKAI